MVVKQLNKKLADISGSYQGVKVKGTAFKKKVDNRLVWQYRVSLIYHPKIVWLESNAREGTMKNLEDVKDRLERACIALSKEGEKEC